MPFTDSQPAAISLDDIARQVGTLAEAARTATGGDDRGLGAAATLLGAIDRLTAAVIAVLQACSHHTVITDHGLTRDTWLRAIAGRTGGDAGMLLAAAERLADMPTVTAWFHDGTLTWGTVRAIVAATRSLTAGQRRWIDDTLADGSDRLLRLDADQFTGIVDGLVSQARPDLHAERETSALRRRWLAITPRLDGTADIHGTLDAETAAAALTAFTTTPTDDDDVPTEGIDGDMDAGDDRGMSAGDRVRASRRRANVDIFRDLCLQRVTRRATSAGDATDPDAMAESEAADADPGAAIATIDAADAIATIDAADAIATIDAADAIATIDAADAIATSDARGDAAGDTTAIAASDAAHAHAGAAVAGSGCPTCGAAPSSARPAMLVIADLATLDVRAPAGSGVARLHWATTNGPVELTPAATQRLACDATLRAVITDGVDILGVTAAHPRVSATMRAALAARDGGCRFPTCTRPVDVCDAHHLTPVADGGPTTLTNLALVCRDHHHAIHDGGWQTTLHADATITFARRGVTLASPPRYHLHVRAGSTPPPGRPSRRRHTATGGTSPPPDRGSGHPPADTTRADAIDREAVGLPF